MKKMTRRIMGAIVGVAMVILAVYFVIRGSELLLKTLLYCAGRTIFTYYEFFKFVLVLACYITAGMFVFIGYELVARCVDNIYEVLDERCEKCIYEYIKTKKKE